MRPLTWAPAAYRQLNGIFCVYKPTELRTKHASEIIKKRLVQDLNALPCYEHEIKMRPAQPYVTPDEKVTVPTLASVPSTETDYSEHRLVLGQRYIPEDIKMSYIHTLPKQGSGVLMFGIGRQGREYIELMSYAKYLRVYHVKGRLGYQTDNGLVTGKFVQRTTFRHVNKPKLDKACGATQSGHQKLMFEYAGVDPNSQEAYELACKGIVRPADSNTPPLLYGVKCIEFDSPDFTLEIHSINEDGYYLADIIHNMGIRLKSSAVCTHIHRIRYGHFNLQHTLLREDWRLESIIKNIKLCQKFMTPRKLLTNISIGQKEEKSTETDLSVEGAEELGAEDMVKAIVARKMRT